MHFLLDGLITIIHHVHDSKSGCVCLRWHGFRNDRCGQALLGLPEATDMMGVTGTAGGYSRLRVEAVFGGSVVIAFSIAP